MALAVELVWGDKPTVGDVAAFVDLLRSNGVGDETTFDVAVSDDEYRTQTGWRVEVDDSQPARQAETKLPTALVRALLDTLRIVAESDGDVRHIQTEVAELRNDLLDTLLDRTLGPGSDEEDDDS